MKTNISTILGEISGYFMSQKGKCSEVVMPTEFLEQKEKEIATQTLLDLLAYFSEYNVPLTMTAGEVQDIISEYIKEEL